MSKKKEPSGGERWLIVGLGNPGKKYVDTRHNVGFEMVDAVGAYYNIKISKTKCKALIGEGRIEGKPVVLAKPQTYMNLSGESVRALMEYYHIPVERLIVIYDDISFPPGKLRIRPKGSAGGHNGMKNIIYQLSDDAFVRVKVGIGAPEGDLVEHVLHKFSKGEVAQLIECAKVMPDIVRLLLSGDVTGAMNQYN